MHLATSSNPEREVAYLIISSTRYRTNVAHEDENLQGTIRMQGFIQDTSG